jgi:hypothetical protein
VNAIEEMINENERKYSFVEIIGIELKGSSREYADAVDSIAFEVALDSFFSNDLEKSLCHRSVLWRLSRMSNLSLQVP